VIRPIPRRALAAGAAALAASLAAAPTVWIGAGCGPPGPPRAADRGDAERPAASPGTANSAAPAAAGPRGAASESVGWLKGTTHVHTIYSGDSRTAVDGVIRWYRDRGYDFIVITDHNRVTEVEPTGSLLVLRGIELTHNPASCEPPPPEPDGKCRIHLNGLVLDAHRPTAEAVALRAGVEPSPVEWKNQAASARLDMYQAGIDKLRQLGGIAQLNHPTWHWGIDDALLAELGRRGVTLVEIANIGFASWNGGSAIHASAEAVWDGALSQGVLIYGVASDDAHHYDEVDIAERRAAGKPVYAAGTGWVMVRAAPRPDAIRRALARGDFYSSTGVLLDRVESTGRTMRIAVAGAGAAEHRIAFVGQGGAVLADVHGRSAELPFEQAPPGYVRAVVTRADGARAWVQPVLVPVPVARDTR